MMGKRLKDRDPQFVSHQSFYREYARKHDVIFVENVTEYSETLVQQCLGQEFEIRSIRICPRNLGLGVARARVYMVAFRSSKIVWSSPYSLEDFADAVASRVFLDAYNYFWQRAPKSILSKAEDP